LDVLYHIFLLDQKKKLGVPAEISFEPSE